MIGFAWLWAFALLPLPWLVRSLLPVAAPRGVATLPIADELLEIQPAGVRSVGSWPWLAVLAWTLLIMAAARPQWIGKPIPLPTQGRDIVLAVDLSGSMDQRDARLHGRKVQRLQAVQAVAGDFIERREGDRVGLVLFGRNAYLHSPLSLDRHTVRQLLEDSVVGLAGRETAIGDAIGIGVKHLRAASQSDDKVLILLTDGVNTAGHLDPAKAAELAAQSGVRVHTIGFGGVETVRLGPFTRQRQSPIDEASLQQVASASGGRYFRAQNTAELEQIYRIIDEIEPVEVDELVFRPILSLAHWPLLASLLLVLITGMKKR